MTETLSQTALAKHAEAIRSLGKRVIADVIKIGKHLTEAKELCGHGNWLPWLEREFGWTDKTAKRLMAVYDLNGKFDNLSDLEIPVSTLYLLAAPSTPTPVVEKVIERAKAGEKIGVAEVKDAINQATDTMTEKKGAKVAKAREIVRPMLLAGEEPTWEKLEAEYGMSRVVWDKAIATEKGVIEAEQKTGMYDPIDTSGLSPKAQQKFEALRRRLEQRFEQQFQEARFTQRNLDRKADHELMLGNWGHEIAQIREYNSRHSSRERPPFTNDEYRKLLAALHPDCRDESLRLEMFQLIKTKELLLREFDFNNFESTLPQTVEELLARRKVKRPLSSQMKH
jgi:hypothetical protein